MDTQVARNASASEYRRLSCILDECRTLEDMQRFAAACHASPCADAEGVVYAIIGGECEDAIGPHEAPWGCDSIEYSRDGRTVTVVLPDGTRATHTARDGWKAAR